MAIQKGLKVPQAAYSSHILEVVHELTEEAQGQLVMFSDFTEPASAWVKQIINQVYLRVKHLLTKVDYKKLEHGERRWKNTVRQELADLRESGLIELVARGKYRLTPAGIAKI